MNMELENIKPADIEKRSFQIIDEILKKEYSQVILKKQEEPVLKRVIHTTADFSYLDSLCFSHDAVEKGKKALQNGVGIVTDTQMAKSGINKKLVQHLGGEVYCFMSDEDVSEIAKRENVTRAMVSMDKAANLKKPLIFAIGNAPTALVRLYELIQQQKIVKPELIIGVPVGFVNVVQAKELILTLNVPSIVAKGRKGGSNVAAAICNALLYELM